jgi:hypothetical protein
LDVRDNIRALRVCVVDYYACTEEGYACGYEKPRKRHSLKSYRMHFDLRGDEPKYVLLGTQLQTQT